MNYLIISGIIGVILGVFSVYRPRAFTLFLLASILIGLLFFQFGGPIHLVSEFNGVRNVQEAWDAAKELFSLLPKDVQSAIIIFPAFYILARILAWLKVNFFTGGESRAKQKRRVLKKYGFKDGIPD